MDMQYRNKNRGVYIDIWFEKTV